MPDVTLDYKIAGPTIAAFHRSDAFVKMLLGPIGSGKTSALCMEILLRAAAQNKGRNGVRRSRWAVLRNTEPQLKSTTMRTWEQWCPPHLGRLTFDSPITHRVQREGFDLEVLFLALDNDADTRKLLSLELTGAAINEAREIPGGIFDVLTGRVGRWPPIRDGGCAWSGVLLDSNMPDTESWMYRICEVERPVGYELFRQPGGRSEHAENLGNLPAGYYDRVAEGKHEDFVRVFIDAEYGFVVEGKPVYGMFRDSAHVAKEPIRAVRGQPLLLGADFGLTPAAVIGQRLADGRWLIIDEVVTDDTGVIRFAELLASYIAREYPGFKCEGWADPAGNARSQTDERTALDIMRQYTGWRWHPAPDNSIALRLESVKAALNRMVDGAPGFLLSPRCRMLRKGFNGGYHYRLVRSGNGALHEERPNKNEFSHPHDGLQYLLSGGGEGAVVMQRQRRLFRPTQAITDYNIFG